MEKYDIYSDILQRTGGDIYLGVVGPVRTGKSTFISRFMESIVLPNISDNLQKQIAKDEMPQSSGGSTIMTTEPKFIPANAVNVSFNNKATANIRLVDCVGYYVEGAKGVIEDDKPRLVKTPWSDKEIPFEKAAEIGTKKVITDYSTIGIVITTDGSFGELERSNYEKSEEKCILELKKTNKPFIILVNSVNPESENTLLLCDEIEKKYGVTTISINVLELTEIQINAIMEKVLLEFPLKTVNVKLPKWMQSLSCEDTVIQDLINKIKNSSKNMCKMKDFSCFDELLLGDENFKSCNLVELNLGKGVSNYEIMPKEEYFYKIISCECREEIKDDYELIKYIKTFSENKIKFSKLQNALKDAEENGYGVVFPTIDEMNLEEPVLVKQGGKYGVKLKATAPSLHIVKVDVGAEVSPIVGTEKQGEDLVNFIMSKFEDNPQGIWETNLFGKSLYDLVGEGLSDKINAMPKDAKIKMRKTLSRIINENKGGLICILL